MSPITPLYWDYPTGTTLTNAYSYGFRAVGYEGLSGGTNFPGMGGGGTLPLTSAQTTALAQNNANVHAVGAGDMKSYAIIGLCNVNATKAGVGNTNISTCMGSWNPTFTDGKGNGWGIGTYNSSTGRWQANSYVDGWWLIGQVLAQCHFDGLVLDNEDGSANPGTGATGNCTQTCSYRYHYNNYGDPANAQYAGLGFTTTAQACAQEQAWAKAAGAACMQALNAGYQANGGVGDVLINTYDSVVAGTPQFPNGYWDVVNGSAIYYANGTNGTYTYQGYVTNITGHEFLQTNTWQYFVAGLASQSTAPVVMGNAFFYFANAISSGPYTSDADGGWARAFAVDRQSVIQNGLPSNVQLSAMMMVADGGSPTNGIPGGTWSQSSWDHCIGALLASLAISGCNNYNTWQVDTCNWANNTFSSGGANQNYTPMNGVPPGVTGQPNAPWVSVCPKAPSMGLPTTTSTSATLTWSPFAGDPNPATSWTVVQGGYAHQAIPGISGPTATINGLTSGQTYQFLVTGVNASGTGAASSVITVTPGGTPQAPGPPLNVVATPGNSMVTLTWQAPASGGPPDSYTILQTGTSINTITNVPTSPLSYPVNGLVNLDPYSFGMEAVNQGGTSIESNIAGPVTPQAPPPTVLPTSLSPLQLWASSSNMVPVPPTTGLITHVRDSAPVTGAASSWTIPIVAPAPNNWLTVVVGGGGSVIPAFSFSGGGVNTWSSITGQGVLNRSAIAYGQVTGTPTTSITVTLLSGNASGGVQMVASEWSNIGGVDVTTGATGTSTAAAPGSLTPPNSNNLLLVAYGTSNHFAASPPGFTALGGINQSGMGGYLLETTPVAQNPSIGLGTSAEWAAVMVAFNPGGSLPQPPGPPLNVAATPGDTTVTLTWTQGTGGLPNSYTILQTGAPPIPNVPISPLSYTVTGLTNGVGYTFGMEAVNQGGTSAESSPLVSATPGSNLVPNAPTLNPAVSGTAEVSLSWLAPTPNGAPAVTSYTVLRSTTTGTEVAIDTGVTTLSYVDATVTSSTTYYYTVEAVNINGPSAQSNQVSVTPS